MKKLTDIRPQEANANRHTERGMKALEQSIQADGWIGAITVAADGETFDGSARLEVGTATGFGDTEPIVVRSDGSRPVIVVRSDIPSADDPRAKRLGVAANRVAELNLEWEPGVLAELAEEASGLFTVEEFAVVSQPSGEPVDVGELWKGMPEFEQEDLNDKYKTLIVHFETEDDYQAFARLIGQTLTPQSTFIWYPYKPTHGVKGSMQGYQVQDES